MAGLINKALYLGMGRDLNYWPDWFNKYSTVLQDGKGP